MNRDRFSGIVPALLLLPVSFGLNVLLFIVMAFAGLWGRLTPERPGDAEEVRDLKASIIIPSWNGKDLLALCLPALHKALAVSGGGHEIIVVDNGSDDGSAAYIDSAYPDVKVIASPENLGFGKAVNLGIRASNRDIVVLLNNDMIVEADFLNPLLGQFKGRPDLFAATCQIFFWDGPRQETGKTKACMRRGSIYPWHEQEFDRAGPQASAYAGGGSSAYDRRKLLALGGFDELYHPFYVEDLDLSFMAWKRGWRVLFVPESKVHHKHRGTIGTRFKPAYVQAALRRNEILFVWKNIASLKTLAAHFAWLWLRLVSRTAAGSFEFTLAYFQALSLSARAAGRRAAENRRAVLGDREVFARSSSQALNGNAVVPAKSPGTPLRILFVCPYIPYPPSHGGAVRMYNLLKQLAKSHQVYLLSFVENEEEFNGLSHLKEFCQEVRLILRRESWRRDNVLWLRPQSSLNQFYSTEFEEALAQMVERYDIDIVQYEYTQMAQYRRNFSRARTVLTEHDVTFLTRYRYLRSLGWSAEKLRAFMRWAGMLVYELDVCRRFDLVCTVSTKEKELLLTYDRSLRVTDAVPTGTDTEYYRPQARGAVEEMSLLFVGFFKHMPNVEGILYFCQEIYPLIKEKVPKAKLYIVGANPPQEVSELAQDPSIIITGFVDDLRDYYARAEVFVVPIRRGAGTRVKIFEAMAAGIPIVSTTLGAEGIAVTPGKDILLADTAEDFAGEVTRLSQNQSLRAVLAKEARDLAVSKYDWASISSRLASEYYSLLREKGEACHG